MKRAVFVGAVGLLAALAVMVVIGAAVVVRDAAEGFMQLVHALDPNGK